MSNCIEIKQKVVHFEPDEINAMGLAQLIAEADQLGRDKIMEAIRDPGMGKYFLAWWFLSKNTEFHDKGVTITFGNGRSGHTWRDFEQTIRLLIKYVKKPKIHRFTIFDEYDDFETSDICLVDFETGLTGSG